MERIKTSINFENPLKVANNVANFIDRNEFNRGERRIIIQGLLLASVVGFLIEFVDRRLNKPTKK